MPFIIIDDCSDALEQHNGSGPIQPKVLRRRMSRAVAHDVFVSYARADDSPVLGQAGWVTIFVRQLRRALGRKLGLNEADVWMDHRLAVNQPVSQALPEKVGGSKVILLIMSPGYQRSDWCRIELESFLARNQDGESASDLFVVELEPVDRKHWPAALKDLTPIQFWNEDQSTGIPQPLGWPVPTDADRLYWTRLNELAHWIAARLSASTVVEDQKKPTIWIAEPVAAHVPDWERLAASLRQLGHAVLPKAPESYPRTSREAYFAALNSDLAQAHVLLQLLGHEEGGRPAWSEISFTALQADGAHSAAAARQLSFHQWRPRSVSLQHVADPDYRRRLTGVLACSEEELREMAISSARKSMQSASTPAARGRIRTAAFESPPCVCVNAEKRDQHFGREVCQALKGLGVDAILVPVPSEQESPEKACLDLQIKITNSDGVIIVYGESPTTWVQSQYILARKVAAQERRTRRVWVVVDAPPPDKPDHGISSNWLRTLDCRHGLDPNRLADFVAQLKG